MIQSLIVIVLLVIAAAYLLRLVYKHFTSPTCDSGCGKCNTIDFKKIERELSKKSTNQ